MTSPNEGQTQGQPQGQGQQTQTLQPPEWYNKPPAWFNQPPQGTPSPPSPNRPSGQELIAAIDALPEKIVNGLREAITPPQSQSQGGSSGGNSGGSNDSGNTGGTGGTSSGDSGQSNPRGDANKDAGPGNVNLTGRERFAKWWFG